MQQKSNAMREALKNAGVNIGTRRQRFTSFRDFFANTDVADQLAKSGMPESKQMKLEDFRDSQQIVDFANLTRNRLYKANNEIGLQGEYISLLESTMLRAGVTLPQRNINSVPSNSEANDEALANQAG